jgi:tetratricopeptide (TPR) repeat protein
MTELRVVFSRRGAGRTHGAALVPRAALLWLPLLLAVSLFLFASRHSAQVPSSAYQEVIADLNGHKCPEAEAGLKIILNRYPDDATALGLMGVALDGQKRYAEAEEFYTRAVHLSPGSTSLFNNLGTHYLAQGDQERALRAYLQAVKINPHDRNANLQLAQICIHTKRGREALLHLEQLSKGEQATPAILLLRAQALALAGKPSAAESLLLDALKQSGADPRIAFSAGMILADWKRYASAEEAFSKALGSDPTDLDVLYNLGLAALGAKDFHRAADAFQVALKQRPDDPDCLYNLGRVYDGQGRPDLAIAPIERAERLAPQRPEILLLLASLTEKLGFYGDAATAYDRYLKLRPHDDLAWREHGFALARMSRTDAALADLRAYVQRKPRDVRGLYELGVVETIHDRTKSLAHFDRALAIDPSFWAARYARAVLYYEAGRYPEALEDLKLVLKHQPNDLGALDTLGETYLQLLRPREAVEALGHAAGLAPKDPLILMHYSRALMRDNQPDEAQTVLHEFQNLAAEAHPARPYSGLFTFLGLPPAQQHAQYLANLQARLHMNPEDATLKVRIAQEELAEGKRDDSLEMFHQVLAEVSDANLLEDCAQALLDDGQYESARGFLEKVLAAKPSRSVARLDLAIALFHTAGPAAGLTELSRIPPDQQKGDFFLLRAQLLDALGKPEEAAAALNRGFEASPTRADLYFQAALFLVKHGQARQMVDMLGRADRIVPDDPKLMLTRAIGFEMLREHEQALALLSQLESRSPTWYLPYEIQGIILTIRIRPVEAKPVLQTAIALGADDAEAYFYLASAIINANTEDVGAAQEAIDKALALDPRDPFTQSLAGRIAYLEKDYPSALQHLNAALAIWPDMVEAHQTLGATYRALGEKDKSVEELKAVLHIKQQNPTADQSPPFPVGNMLFTVRPPSTSASAHDPF